MKPTLIYVAIACLIISWCGKPTPSDEETKEEKQAYYITTRSVEELSTANTIKKSWRLMWAQAVTVSSLVPGRVQSIAHLAWETVNSDTVVIQLRDTSWNYSFTAQRAKAQLEGARISYEQTAANLEKAINDSALWVKQAQTQYNASIKNGEGSTALQLQQLEQQIEKAELDYNTQLQNNQQTIDNFFSTAQNLARDVELLYTTVVTESDKILGVSDNYKHLNDTFERQLSAKNTALKRLAEGTLNKLIKNEPNYKQLSTNISKDTLTQDVQKIMSLAKQLQPVLDQLENVLQFSVSSPNNLPETQLNGFIANIDGLQTQTQGSISAITQQINAMESFLSTYKEQEESLRKQVEITKQQVASTKSSLQDNEVNAEIGVESAASNYENALKTKQTTLASLSNSIEQARIAYNEAQNQLAKFSVRTPINGTIGEILVDIGQEVNPGTPLFTVSSTNEQQIEISLSEDELPFVEIGQEVRVFVDDQEHAGTVQSISKTADQNFTYKTVISLNEASDLFGDVVRVEIPVRTPYPLIPLEVVSILDRNEGLVQTRNDGVIEPQKVSFGKVWWSYVEITSELDEDIYLIISDVNNFNPNKQRLVEDTQP